MATMAPPLHTGWLCTVSFVSEHALQLFWLEAVETLCLCACLLRFCVVYSACTCSMQHAACGLFVYLPQQQHSLQQQLPRGCQSMASRLHKHQCASFLQPSPPPATQRKRVCCTLQSKCPNALILLVSVEHFVYLYSTLSLSLFFFPLSFILFR